MALSTMQEIFILLEDEKEVPLYRINRWGRQARGALAKLKNMGWAEKLKKDDEPYYQITPKGERYVDDILKAVKVKENWDKKWRLVMFDIPESQRSVRDRLRRILNNLGLGILQASVWISTEDIKDKIDSITEKLELGSKIKYFEVSASPSLNLQVVEKAWNIPEISEKLDKFTKEAEYALKGMGKGNGDKFSAKKLIFEYALIAKQDPKLPVEFFEQNGIRKHAYETYLRLRNFVV